MWLVALPAFASGPLCDDRGATRIAPNPTLIVPQESFATQGGSDTDCNARSQEAAYHDGHRAPERGVDPTPAQAVLPEGVNVIDAPEASPLCVHLPRGGFRPGTRYRIERPPRS